MTRFESIEVDPADAWCCFCDAPADYLIDDKCVYLENAIPICRKCLSVINRKAALIDGNEEI